MFNALQSFIAWAPLGLPAYLFVITVVVFFHELGHFSMARAFGIRVETFSIGFGPAIVSWMDRKGTRWKISWIPFGGYVKFFGDLDAASVPDREHVKSLTPEEKVYAYPLRPVYQRAAVSAAGPVANFILAIVIFTLLFSFFGRVIQPPVVSTVAANSAAAQAGIHVGDTIRSIDGQTVESFDEIRSIVWMRTGQPLRIVLNRAGKDMAIIVTPRLATVKDELGEVHHVGQLGISAKVTPGTLIRVKYNPLQAAGAAVHEVWNIISSTLGYLGQMVTGKVATSELHGPLGIAKISGQIASISFLSLVSLAALISVSIGLINLFPIPILDGGHLLYYACEAVMGRPLGERAQDVGFRLGLAVVLGLFVLATWNDLVRLNLF